ncbi:hypothetical protein GFS31_41720 (plasmid) [Leptolyngbya sp. BL0902]|uniref:hypothetical protein n=1 Tax=Leptolyngbya sp. BL0902 TaxID=1115757 RepID=UPI0018E8F408|nr:hypothetical protein [Leptolyngbya sp. BL0902]QQE67459.1 hypothetical protein GFS31_41720 [Leptolyngbya sp. BL0902]
MQHVTVTTYLQGRTPKGALTEPEGYEEFELTRAHPFAPWECLGYAFTLYPIHPGQTYQLWESLVRTVCCSSVY